MILDDFIMLGKTVPEVNSDGRQFVCTAGYSLELRQPIRIYPMARRGSPARWSISRIPLERNSKDSRPESWKIRGDRRPGYHDDINRVIEPVQDRTHISVQRDIVRAMAAPSLREANERRLSLCVIMPDDIPSLVMEPGEKAEMTPTPDMFGDVRDLPVSARFAWHPRLRFVDQGGHKHDLMLRDWGCYELMRKHDDISAFDMAEALNLSSAAPILCGNLNHRRNAWLVISVFHSNAHARPDVFDRQPMLFDLRTGAPPPQPSLPLS
jgi:hypothetical protein